MAYRTISDSLIHQMILEGEVPHEIRNAAEKVLVVLTQDWCPDWHAMEGFLPQFEEQVAIFVLEYNKHADFEKIMEFKEEVFKNREIPYLRYFHEGQFIVATNQLPKGTFAALLKKTMPFQFGS